MKKVIIIGLCILLISCCPKDDSFKSNFDCGFNRFELCILTKDNLMCKCINKTYLDPMFDESFQWDNETELTFNVHKSEEVRK